jgi:DNA-binding NarL/FixJ family response regulator
MAAQQADGLTEREIEVLDLLARGHSDADIGRRMGISARTVAFHVAEARERLGAATRIQAVLAAIRDGWLPLSGG